jgi:hypothetical protein
LGRNFYIDSSLNNGKIILGLYPGVINFMTPCI